MTDNPLRSAPPLAIGLAILAVGAVAACSQQVAESPADPELAKPSADECAIAKAAMSAIHSAGLDARWRSSAGVTDMSLRTRSQVVNPADLPNYSDDEEANLLGKAPADWRGCAQLETFLTGLGWKPMGDDQDFAELGLGRPAVNKTGDEAKVYETFAAPVQGGLKLAAGPWVATLRRGPGGWQVSATDAVGHAKS